MASRKASLTKNTLFSNGELTPAQLYRACDPNILGFNTTDELPDLQHVIGQPRAMRALQMGSEIPGAGYNIFVLGSPGSGRTTISREYLRRKALSEPAPDDWCFVYNFENPHQPKALRLKAGKGVELRIDVHELVMHCNQETLLHLGPLIQPLKEKYHNSQDILDYLEALQADITLNADHFQAAQKELAASPFRQADWLRRYEVNLLIDNSKLHGAPVILENNPTLNNLLGYIEHEMITGTSHTDQSLIHPGALQRANGGYLILPARDILLNPNTWEGLKRALRDQEVRTVEMANQSGQVSTSILEPQPIPLTVKILLVGTPTLYYMLRAYDEDFSKLFKVRAEFASLMERNTMNETEYGLFVKSVVQENHLPSFDKTAVARIIEYSSRLADDQGKLSMRFGKIADLVREAAYWAETEKHPVILAPDVQRAIDEYTYRSNLIEERFQELIDQGTLRIDLQGKVIGQVNALSIFALGDYDFGRPSRVTAVTYPGKAGVVDIERQAKLGGALHTKGVLILSGYLNARYGQEQPLSLSASVTFEQTYEEVQGDSASAAELLALLSAIARAPLRQDRAVTGSVDQLGQLQAIGGVSEKIEGFYAACKAVGLSGEQGVIIPSANQRHLMLNAEVVKAVTAKRFHIWAVHDLDQALKLLTDLDPGERQADGSYPPGTFSQLVTTQLSEYSKALQATSSKALPPGQNEKENKPDN